MAELLLALGVATLVVCATWLGALLAPEIWMGAGAALVALGLAVGVPTGFWYHVRLRASLAAQGPLPRRWWLRPVAFHGRLAGAERRRVLRWFAAGGAGFAVVVLGCLGVAFGVAVHVLRAP